MPGSVSIAGDEADALAARFQLLGKPSRLRVVLACLGEPTRVSDIAARTGLSATLVSYHLRPLRQAGLLRARRVGREVLYAAASARVPEVIRAMREVGAESTGEGTARGMPRPGPSTRHHRPR